MYIYGGHITQVMRKSEERMRGRRIREGEEKENRGRGY
jgi:hypothetical protein